MKNKKEHIKREYTLKEAARIMGVSPQTVKRRIDKGTIKARKETTEAGIDLWLIPADQIQTKPTEETIINNPNQTAVFQILPAEKTEPIPKKPIGIHDVQKVVQNILKAQTEEIKTHIYQLENKIDNQTQLLEAQNSHYRLVDERLRQIMDEKKERPTSKPLWKRIFNVS